jgi:hypothetical protein
MEKLRRVTAMETICGRYLTNASAIMLRQSKQQLAQWQRISWGFSLDHVSKILFFSN